ncbi:MAG: hypothetical protein JWN48_2496 [Myxococcaceae bacterium]|nr:hypothetical protein [Myxococcaceae bacterium]
MQPQLSSTAVSPSGIQLVESLFDAFKVLNLERALALMSEDIEYQNVPLPPDRGKHDVRRTLNLMAKVATQFDVRMHHIAERDGVVLTERTDIIRGPLLDLEFWVCGTFEIRDGKIAVWRDRFDVGTFLLQAAFSPLRVLRKKLG